MELFGRRSARRASNFIGDATTTLTVALAVAGALMGRRAAIGFAREAASALGGFHADHTRSWTGGELALMALRQRN